MTVITSRNTIKLGNSASSIDGYYVGRIVELTRIDQLGRKTTQRKVIKHYSGASRVATIEGIWINNYHPKPGDSYKIVPRFSDGRVSINPAIQTLDYINSKAYGRGLDVYTDLKLNTWLESARICDTRSDIWVEVIGGGTPSIGAKYVQSNSSIWQGTVAEVSGNYVRFTDNLGKLSYKWNNWRFFKVGQLVYEGERLYIVTSAGVKTNTPTHINGADIDGLAHVNGLGINKLQGSGPNALMLAYNGNPVRYSKNGVPQSGYTLYDSDGVDYFRYLGWNSPDQREVTRHQTNISIDTSLPLFDNTNSLLQHFGGILRYSGDKYILEVEQPEGDISTSRNEPRNITSDDIIGRISITDEGIRNSYNSLTAAYSDPANKFEARNISFFNSDFLKSDRNVPKKGNLSIPGITNYYNARMLADKYLVRSRFGLSVNMNLTTRSVLLLPGKVIQVQYPRYGWVNKKFRIENLTHNDDCTVDIVANEHDNSFYTISGILKGAAIGLAGEVAMTVPSPPVGMVTTSVDTGNELVSAVQISWVDNPSALSPNVMTEIYASYSPYIHIVADYISNDVIYTKTNHGLKVGQHIYKSSSQYGFVAQRIYYVKDIPSANSFTISETKNGPQYTGLSDTGDDFELNTAVVIGEVTPPTNTFVDTDVYSITGTRVEKYYWLRYKVRTND